MIALMQAQRISIGYVWCPQFNNWLLFDCRVNNQENNSNLMLFLNELSYFLEFIIIIENEKLIFGVELLFSSFKIS